MGTDLTYANFLMVTLHILGGIFEMGMGGKIVQSTNLSLTSHPISFLEVSNGEARHV